MKTIKIITLALGVLALTFSLNLNAATEHFTLEDEAYIEDIPFNTECVSAGCLYEKALAVEFNFEEETFIKDIPFNTECVTTSCRYQKAINKSFSFEDESYIDDIPFNTYSFVKRMTCSSLSTSK